MADIGRTYLAGRVAQLLGPDWKEKRALQRGQIDMQEAQLESERMRPGLLELQAQQAREGLETEGLKQKQAQMDLEEATREYEETKRLFAEGKIGSTSLKTAEYLLKEAESKARIASEEAQARSAGALAHERGLAARKLDAEMKLLETPEEARKTRGLRDKYLEAQTGAVEALGGARQAGRQFAGVPVPDQVWEALRSEAEKNVPLTEGESDWLPFNEDDTEKAARQKLVEEEILRMAKMRGYLNRGGPPAGMRSPGMGEAGPGVGAGMDLTGRGPAAGVGPKIVRDASGQQYMELPNGARIPIVNGPVRGGAEDPEF